MTQALSFREINLADGSDLSQAAASLLVHALIDDNPDTVTASTARYVTYSDERGRRHYALTRDGQLIGVASLRSDDAEPEVMSLDGIVIDPAQRGQNYGRALLGLVAQRAADAGARELTGGTWILGFFARFGFEGDRRAIHAPIDTVVRLTDVAGVADITQS